MLMVQAVGGRQLDHIKDLLGDPECGPKAWRKLLDVHSPTHATGIVLLTQRLRDIKFVDGEPMQPSWSALAINLNSQQPQWSVDYIRPRILEEDLRRRSVERSEEGASYVVGGGKSGFKKKWKGKNKDNPKEDGGGGQGEVCFYCKKRGHRWRKCNQRPKDWTPPSSSNQRDGTRSGGVMGASGEEKDEEKGGKSEERKAGFFFFMNEGATDLAMAAKAAAAASMEESVTEEEQQGVQEEELIGGSAAVKASATSGQADWETWHRRLSHVAVSTLEVIHKEKFVLLV
ncbi:unnamed protein product [Closterium sp. NIES-65]|nr:unnamed protein product [Closterium sp. NIES-65]